MKSTASDYVSVEADTWQPMQQEMVNRGERNSWSLYWVRYGDRSTCDYYTVTTYLGSEQLNANPAFEELFEAAHPRADFDEAMSSTVKAREHVASELWVAVDGISP